ncbi:MAG TPA: hypothetical protein VJP45_01110 [Candidatus Limnocylindria bacterium]|nr:hypothetical protein [Candidatus Limnocylindria bacterium]
MDDPRLVALGLVPAPAGQQDTEQTPAPPETPPTTPEWQTLEQSQYMPSAPQAPNPFSAAASAIPEFPDPFTSPAAAPPRPAPPPQPTVPSIFNAPNSPFAFAPQTAPETPAVTEPISPASSAASAPAAFDAPSAFTSPASPFAVGAAATSFTPAAVVAPTKVDKKALKRAEEEAKRNAKLAEENAVKAAKLAEKQAKENAKLAAAQAKIDAAQARIDAEEAKKAAKLAAAQAKIDEREAKKAAKRGAAAEQVAAPAPFVPPPAAPAPQPFVAPAVLAPAAPARPPAYLELMAAIGKHPNVIRQDVRFGLVGRARLELSPMGIALVGLRSGTAYTWAEVKDVQARRGRLEIKTEADRERTVKTKDQGPRTEQYVEKMTRSLMVSIEGAAEPGLATYIARVMQDMRAQTFNYHATSWLEYENAVGRIRDEFAEHDDPFVPVVAGALFAFIFLAGLFILPEIVNLASDIRPPANSGVFVVQPRYSWLDLRSFVMAIGLSALLTRLVLRLGLGSSALSWARGSVRGWHTRGPIALRIASRELARLLLATTASAAALLLGFAAFAPTVASTLVIDSVGVREVVPLPIVGIDKRWVEVTDVQRSEGPGRLEGFGVTIFFSGGRWITTVDHDLSGGTDGQLLRNATAWWHNATR